MIPGSTARVSHFVRNPHFRFAALLGVSLALFAREWIQIVRLSVDVEHYSHIVLIPLITAYLLYVHRARIFREIRSCSFGALLLPLAAAAYFAGTRWQDSLGPNDSLSLRMAAFVLVWFGVFLLSYGARAFRAAIFPVVFLALVVPLPEVVLEGTIRTLVAASAEVTAWLFRLAGVPTLREGSVFLLPGVAIEVAKECSGIRSSLALLITSLLTGHFLLETRRSMVVLALATVPIAILKNGIRIVTLTLLAVYVDTAFLTGRLHRQGGVVFFVTSLLFLAAVLWLLRRLDSKSPRTQSEQPA